MEVFDTAIVGGGIAGYAAALTAKNLHLNALWLGEEKFSFKTGAAEYVRNYPTFSGDGKGFLAALEAQRERENVPFTRARVDGVYGGENFLLTAGKESFSARTVILCTGVDLRGSLKGERELVGKGVSYCAVCDGALYRGRDIAAILSERRFCTEVEYLASFARTVHAFPLFGEAAFAAENVVLHGEAPLSIEGEERVNAVRTREGSVPVEGVFLLKSATPPASLVGGLQTDGAHVLVQRDLSTNLKGLFAAGDVTGPPYQYAKAAGEGLTAAYSVRAFLQANKE